MRIAFITPEYASEESYGGGLANYLGRITTALAERGHDVHVFTKSYVGNEVIDYRGVTVHRVVPLWDLKMRIDRIDRLAPRSLYAPYQDLKAAWSLWKRWKRAHREQPFDVVQVANVLAVGLFFRYAKDIPVVTRLSCYRPAWDTAVGVEMTRSVRTRWWMEKLAIRGTKHIYSPTQYVARLTEENYKIPHIDVIETPFFMEEPRADLSEYNRHCKGKEYLLFFGRMTQMKGVHRLAEALPGLMKQFPNMHAVFVGGQFVAPGGGQMHNYIREQTDAFRDRVTVLDAMRHDKLYPIIKNAKVVAIPSLIDNLPNTCLEAMALGRVVVATTGTCFEQLIVDGKSGILVEPDDVVSLAEGLSRAWLLPQKKREEMGCNAIARIQQLSPEIKVPELVEYFDSLRKREITNCGQASIKSDQPQMTTTPG